MLRSAKKARRRALYFSQVAFLMAIQGDRVMARRCLQSARRLAQLSEDTRHVARRALSLAAQK